MWKNVCSDEGEKKFVEWIKKLIDTQNDKKNNIRETSGNKSLQNDSNINNTNIESDEDFNPDPSKYIDRNNLRMLYDVLNVKTTHGIDFQSFFELMKIASDDMEEDTSGNDDFVLLSVLDFFCVNFIRGFNKLILDLGFDSFENDFEIGRAHV